MSKKIKIAILADFPTWILHASNARSKTHYATWLPALYEEFQKHDEFEIHWITLNYTKKKRETLAFHNQFFHLLPRAKKTIGLYSFYLYERFQIWKAIKHIKPDLVHAWGVEDCYALAGSDFNGKKLLSVQGLLQLSVKLSCMPKFQKRHSFYEPVAIKRFKFITGESPYAVEHIQQINTHADVQQFEYAVDDCFHTRERTLSTEKSFLFVGTNTHRKNLAILIKAFSSPELSHLKLKLAGVTNHEIGDLPKNITALGRLNREEIAICMAETWGLLVPSFTETGPTVAKEAKVSGLPIMISDECGCKQYIVEGKSGFIVKPNDLEAVKKAILEMSRSEETNIAMGAYQLNQCRHLLSKERMYDEIRNRYLHILNL